MKSRVLKVGINHAQQIGIGVCPPVGDGAGQTGSAGTHQKTHAGF
jgi:hypothetical protein